MEFRFPNAGGISDHALFKGVMRLASVARAKVLTPAGGKAPTGRDTRTEGTACTTTEQETANGLPTCL